MPDELAQELKLELELIAMLRVERTYWAAIPGDREHQRATELERALDVAVRRAVERAREYADRGAEMSRRAGFIPPL